MKAAETSPKGQKEGIENCFQLAHVLSDDIQSL